MSCTICRLPYIPSSMSVDPTLGAPPAGLLPPAQAKHYENAWLIGTNVMGAMARYQYNSNNVFGGMPLGIMMPVCIVWQSQGGSLVTCHDACAALLRRRLDAEGESAAEYIKVVEVEAVLGRPGIDFNAGRFPNVDHENVGEKIDLAPFWNLGASEGMNIFDYEAFRDEGLLWLLARPDTFPRFYPTVTEKRLGSVGEPVKQGGTLVNLPLDLISVLVDHLDSKSFVNFVSTCRLLRRYALTDFQSVARKLVLSLPWSTATQVERSMMSAAIVAQIAHEGKSPQDGDWLLYLSHIHRTSSMRVRRHIYAQVEMIASLYEQRRPGSNVVEGREAKALENKVKSMYAMKKGDMSMMKEVFGDRPEDIQNDWSAPRRMFDQ